MSNSIGSVGQLVAVIKAHMSPRLQKAPVRPQGTARTVRPRGRYDAGKLTALISNRVRQIGRDDPQRGRKALRVFLEAVLLSHLGESLVEDPQFFQMVDDIQSALEGDAGSRTLVDSAIAYLLDGDA